MNSKATQIILIKPGLEKFTLWYKPFRGLYSVDFLNPGYTRNSNYKLGNYWIHSYHRQCLKPTTRSPIDI